ncbi:MAG TPA: chloride channel protein [Chloroflexota bacterium]|nr:chloride channel protein [Chloroflexota bacterium]
MFRDTIVRLAHWARHLENDDLPGNLGDFIRTTRLVPMSFLAIGVGSLSALVALALLRLIGLITNLLFFQRWTTTLVSPAGNHLGLFVIVVPVAGALVIGLMARYGSERIRGHGIPEAIEAILINGSKVDPKVALLKPIASAISIGSGGPFGAEGPIIMTGGALGSMIAQFFHLTSVERKTLLVAGAAGGMSATFNTPLAAILLAVELLLFELKPRSAVPVALASASAAMWRHYLLGGGPIFPTPPHAAFIGPLGLACCVVVGLLAGGLSVALTNMVYAAEDAFHRLPIHWMWWPPIGAVAVGLGGFVFPQALGVGYGVIGSMLSGTASSQIILGVLLVKSTIWAISLGSGTSGGVLAPLLMMGCALGGMEAGILPHEGIGFWPLISMGAILGGAMRSPLTGIVFTLELTHDFGAVLPLTVAVFVAHGLTVLTLRRSILTEKISRKGYHLSREYAIDPLEILLVREVMRTNIVAIPSTVSSHDLPELHDDNARPVQHLYPVVNARKTVTGVVTRHDLQKIAREHTQPGPQPRLDQVVHVNPIVAYPDEPLRVVAYRMATSGRTRFPVISREEPHHLLGMVALNDLLRARERNLEEERTRERVLRLHWFVPRLSRGSNGDDDGTHGLAEDRAG